MVSILTEHAINYTSYLTEKVKDKCSKSLFKFAINKIVLTVLTGKYQSKTISPGTLPGVPGRQYFYHILIDHRETN